MLLDEDPATLIHHTIGNFNIHPDKTAIGRINESLSTLQQARDLRIRDAENALKKLSRNFQTLATQHSETVSAHSSTDHASQIVELDTQKFRVAKAASDLEIEGERLEQELEGLKGRLRALDMQGIEGDEAMKAKRELEDPTILKLKVYRSLGIDLDLDGTGAYNKATIRNTHKGDVHVVNIDPKFSKFFYANYFWQTL
ncbi:MAG: hypothetical protein LQ343_005890 [Gyalolechia ehrenbergii]|nr:MAG: hypothetical protein LQ343_005890 [Gyalolechia ehrenbergii]